MKKRLLSTVFFFSFFWANAQTFFAPDFRLGDTSQIHILTTYRGDYLMGTVTDWVADSIFVSLNGKGEMWLKLSSLESVWVAGESSPPSLNSVNKGIFIMSAKGGSEVYSGRLKVLDKRQIKFHPDNKGLRYFALDELDHVKFLPHPVGYANEFTLKKEGKRERTVQFISFEKGLLTVREEGKIKTYSGEDKVTLYLIKQRPSTIGRQRQLLLSPTGFNLKAKQGIYQNSMLLHNEVAQGLTKHFSVSAGGFSILPYFAGRVAYSPHRLVHLSVGGLWPLPIEGDGVGFHMAATFGTRSYFVNIARTKFVGKILGDINDFQATSLGASVRVGSRIFLFGECNFIDQHPGGFAETLEGRLNIFSGGMKIFSGKNAVSIGLMGLGPRGQLCSECPLSNTLLPAFSATLPFGM